MSHAKSSIVYVENKLVAIDNTTLPDISKLQLELAENAKALAANPSRVDAAILNARQAAITAALKTLHATE